MHKLAPRYLHCFEKLKLRYEIVWERSFYLFGALQGYLGHTIVMTDPKMAKVDLKLSQLGHNPLTEL